jgi:hypothetical protein
MAKTMEQLREDQASGCPDYRSYKEKPPTCYTQRRKTQRERKGRCKYILALRRKKEFHTADSHKHLAIKCIVLLSF